MKVFPVSAERAPSAGGATRQGLNYLLRLTRYSLSERIGSSTEPRAPMSDKSALRLHSVSITVTAQFHNPSILNPDFLKIQKVVPARWKHTETLTSPGYSTITFDNGVKWVVEPEKMTISQPMKGEFRTKTLIHQIAEKYIDRLPHVPYTAVGLNCQVSILKSNASEWLKQRFLKPGKWLKGAPHILNASVKFRLQAKPGVCNLTFSSGVVTEKGQETEPSIVIECNFHHQGPYSPKQLKSIIASWPNQERFLLSALKKLLTGQLR